MLFILDWLKEGVVSLVESVSEDSLKEELKNLLVDEGEVEILTVAYA